MSALLLGVGNVLLTDEAIGVRVVEQFEQQYDYGEALEVLDGGTAGMELLEAIANRDLVVIADAVVTGASPGTIVTLTDVQVPTFFAQKISPHQLGLSDLLSALIMTDEHPKKIILIGIVPESVEPQIGLTDTVGSKLDKLVLQVAETLRQQGIKVEEATVCA